MQDSEEHRAGGPTRVATTAQPNTVQVAQELLPANGEQAVSRVSSAHLPLDLAPRTISAASSSYFIENNNHHDEAQIQHSSGQQASSSNPAPINCKPPSPRKGKSTRPSKKVSRLPPVRNETPNLEAGNSADMSSSQEKSPKGKTAQGKGNKKAHSHRPGDNHHLVC